MHEQQEAPAGSLFSNSTSHTHAAAAAASAPSGALVVAGPWGAASFLDAAEPVLRVLQLACACADEVALVVDVDLVAPSDAKRLLSIAKALAARIAPVSEVRARMRHPAAEDADDAGTPRSSFGKALVAYLRELPRTPRDAEAEPPQKRQKPEA